MATVAPGSAAGGKGNGTVTEVSPSGGYISPIVLFCLSVHRTWYALYVYGNVANTSCT